MVKGVPLATLPYWADSATLPRFAKLDRDEQVDVVIVGGGITGLTAAYLLTVAGKTVAVVERDRCAATGSGLTSAHLTMVTDRPLTALVKSFGREHAQAVWDSGLAAISQIDSIVRNEHIDCDYTWVRGYVHSAIAQKPAGERRLFLEEARLASDLGFDAEFVADVPFVGGPGVMFPDQARFNPRKYLAALGRAITDRGGLIFEHTSADELGDQPTVVKANGRTLKCAYIVLATHAPVAGIAGAKVFQARLTPYTSYVIAGRIDNNHIPDALFWDTANPHHYLRVDRRRDHDVVIFGGEDHQMGQPSDSDVCFDRLERTLKSMNGRIDITHRWSGQVIETPDGLPYIGETGDRQFAGTGFSGNGLTFGTLTAMMATDRIIGRRNPWSELFHPGRKKILSATWDNIRERLAAFLV